MNPLGELRRRIDATPPALWLAVVAVAAVAYRGLILHAGATDTVSFQVKGMPVSDGRSWDALAVDFAAGTRWDGLWSAWRAHRPLYWLVLGSVYALTGPSVEVARLLNAALGVGASLAIFETLRRVRGASFALVGGLAVALWREDARLALPPGTEMLGVFLGALAALLAVQGLLDAEAGQPHRLRLLGAGLSIGLANLARPLTLPVVPAWLLILVWAWRPRVSWREVAAGTVALSLGVLLVLTPWLVRQRVRYGMWSLSTNGAEMTFAASSRRYRMWGAAVTGLAPRDAGPRERARFFEEGTRRNLAEDPWFWPENAAHQAALLAPIVRPAGPPLFFGAALLVLAALPPPRDRRRFVRSLGAGLAVLTAVVLMPPLARWGLVAASVVWAIPRRDAMLVAFALPAATLAGMAVLILGDGRFLIGVQILLTVIALDGALAVFTALGGLRGGSDGMPAVGRAPGSSPRLGRVPARFVALGGGLAVLLVGVGLLRATVAARHGPPRPPSEPDAATAAAWIDAALEVPEMGPYARLRPRLVVRYASLRPGYRAAFAAGERASHWNPLFSKPRRYAFTVFETRPQLPEFYGVWPGVPVVEPGVELVLVGLPVARPAEGGALEVIAWALAGAPVSAAVVGLPPPASRAAHAQDLSATIPEVPAPPRPGAVGVSSAAP